MPVSGPASEATFKTWGNCTPGYCLHYVWSAYKANGAQTDGAFPTAYSGWTGSAGKHPDDLDAPAGTPMYLGPRAGSSAGDVVMSLGGGMVRATDWPYNGVIGNCTIQQRIAQTGRPYLGWTETILNDPITDIGGQDMDSNQAWQLQALYNLLLVFDSNNSPQYSWAGATLNEIRGVAGGGIMYPGAGYNAFAALANNQAAMQESLNAILAKLDPAAPPVQLEPVRLAAVPEVPAPEPSRPADDGPENLPGPAVETT